MVKRIDLTGKIFGDLSVLSYEGDKKWLCKCSCGVERLIYSSSLRKGKTHCGCQGVRFPERFKDLQGKVFSKLVVLKKDENLRKRRAYWLCKCECGNETLVRGSHLLSGQTKSCGCLTSINLSGKTFGRLKVVCDSGKRTSSGRQIIWKTICECGNEKFCSTTHLKQKHSTHCGCVSVERRIGFENIRLKSVLAAYKGSAKSRKIKFELTLKDIEKIIEKSCFYCGSEPDNEKYIHPLKGETEKRKIKYQGIDRVDSNVGYTPKNIIPCCKRCNLMKRDMSKNEFLNHIEKIMRNLK